MRWRFSWDEWKNRKYYWHTWFAWRPVEVDLADNIWCWFSFIQRRRIRDSECGDHWDYREHPARAEVMPPGGRRWTRSDDWYP